MKPLQAIGLGLIWIILTTQDTRVDWFPDPIGWATILLGLRGLRRVDEVAPRWSTLLALALAALAASIVLWLPAGDAFITEEPSVGWALNLPGFAFFALLCHVLVSAASVAREDPYAGSSALWLRLVEIALIAVALAPVFVFGAGWEALGPYAQGAAQIALLTLTFLCFIYASRPWAGGPAGESE